MSNSIFDWPASLKRFVRFTSAKAEDVNDALDSLSAGLDTVEANIARAVKLPVGTADQTLALAAGQRAGLLLGFDPLGNIAGVAGGGRWRGDWVTGTTYVISDIYRDPSTKNVYACVELHTSTTVAADLAAGKVRLAIDVADVESQRALAQQAAINADASYQLAAQKASDASGFAGDALDQANIAAARSVDADIARAAAVDAKLLAESALDSFDDRYLGPKASDPSTDNDGAALIEGALYWNTSFKEMRVWNGSSWGASYLPAASYATKEYADNTSPVVSPTWHFMLNL